MFYVYILENKEGSHYIGHTNDLQRRIRDHNYGKNGWTRRKGPWNLIYTEKFQSKKDAYLREQHIKRYKGGEAFRKLLSK